MSKYIEPEAMTPDPEAGDRRSHSTKRAFTGFGASLLLVLAFVLFFHFNFTTVIVSGPSMSPTLKNGKKVLVSKAYWLVGPIEDGDIVVIKQHDGPDGFIIKRVYKMAGETVDTLNAPVSRKLTDGPYLVAEGDAYVLGDNRSVSEDSRKFGAVSISGILGKVVAY